MLGPKFYVRCYSEFSEIVVLLVGCSGIYISSADVILAGMHRKHILWNFISFAFLQCTITEVIIWMLPQHCVKTFNHHVVSVYLVQEGEKKREEKQQIRVQKISGGASIRACRSPLQRLRQQKGALSPAFVLHWL